MRELVVQWLLHASVAAGVVELLLARWRPACAGERVALRGLALTLPMLEPAVLHAVAPFRLDPVFADTWALFASRHWTDVGVGGVRVGTLLLGAAVGSGAWLYLRDLLPLVRDARRRDEPRAALIPGAPLVGLVREVAATLRLARAPEVRLLDDEVPVLFVAGAGRPILVVSRGAIARLDPETLRAVVAHELAHLSRGDLVLGWILMTLRTAMVFNPVTQLVARGIALELERRADEAASFVVGDPALVAAGIERLLAERMAPSRNPTPGSWRRALGGAVAARAQAVALKRRTARLRARWPPVPSSYPRLRMVLAGASLATLLFFVV